MTCDDSSVSSGIPLQQFEVDEEDFAVDVNGDGDTGDENVSVVPIIWAQFDTGSGSTKTFNVDFLDEPKHAFDLVSTKDGWKTNTGVERPDGGTIVAPAAADIASCDLRADDLTPNTGDTGKCPVWVMNEFGEAVALLPGSVY